MSIGAYILNEAGEPVACGDLNMWATTLNDESRKVKVTELGQIVLGAGLTVSTVFLGLDHNYSGVGDPVLWETMIFADDELCFAYPELDQPQWRYRSKDEAVAHHAAIVQSFLNHALEIRMELWLRRVADRTKRKFEPLRALLTRTLERLRTLWPLRGVRNPPPDGEAD